MFDSVKAGTKSPGGCRGLKFAGDRKLEHAEKWKLVFRKVFAQTTNWSGMTLRRHVIPL
jgi:hypothetical protein